MQSGRWAECRPGETPHEITSGDPFHIEFAGKLHLTRMKFRYSPRGAVTTLLTAIRCAMVCALRSARTGKKFQRRSQRFAVCRGPRAAASLSGERPRQQGPRGPEGYSK
jgi:hypothetical protein